MAVPASLVPLVLARIVCPTCYHKNECCKHHDQPSSRCRRAVRRIVRYANDASPIVVACAACASVVIALAVALGIPAVILAAVL